VHSVFFPVAICLSSLSAFTLHPFFFTRHQCFPFFSSGRLSIKRWSSSPTGTFSFRPLSSLPHPHSRTTFMTASPRTIVLHFGFDCADDFPFPFPFFRPRQEAIRWTGTIAKDPTDVAHDSIPLQSRSPYLSLGYPPTSPCCFQSIRIDVLRGDGYVPMIPILLRPL